MPDDPLSVYLHRLRQEDLTGLPKNSLLEVMMGLVLCDENMPYQQVDLAVRPAIVDLRN